MSLQEGESVVATILFADRGYFAIQKADASVWVVDAVSVHGEPQVGQSVVIEHDRLSVLQADSSA
jgi:hypothetical protein